MAERDWSTVAEEAVTRDPRKHTYGFFGGGTFVLDTARVFSWFSSVDELASYLRDIEPRVFQVEPGEGLEELQERLEPVLRKTHREGLTEALRRELQTALDDAFSIEWWGSFEDLCNGRGEFGRQVLEAFRGNTGQTKPVTPKEAEQFATFLMDYGV